MPSLLGAEHGTVALTKADRVLPERLDDVRAEIQAILSVTALAGSPIFPPMPSRPTTPGVAALRDHLQVQAQLMPARAQDGLFRLAVDRLTLPGQGTVVTGTVFNGRVNVGDQLLHSASGQSVRVRSIHAQNQASDTGVAGQRCALNLAGIAKEDIQRGDWILDSRLLQATDRIDIRLHLLAEARSLAQWTCRCMCTWAPTRAPPTSRCCRTSPSNPAPKCAPSWCWMRPCSPCPATA